MNNWRCHTTMFLSLLLWCTPASSIEPFTIGVIDWCPYICPGHPKQPGILVEYTRAIYEGSDYQIKIDVYPWSRAILYALDGTSDALLAPSKHEAPNLVFPKVEIFSQTMCFFTVMDNPWEYMDAQSLTGKTIVYPQDALPEILLIMNKNATFTPKAYTRSFRDQVGSMLLSNRIEIVLANDYTMARYLKSKQLTDKIKSAGCLPPEKIYLAFTPNENSKKRIKHLMEIYEKRIKVLIKNKFLKGLLEKYQLH